MFSSDEFTAIKERGEMMFVDLLILFFVLVVF